MKTEDTPEVPQIMQFELAGVCVAASADSGRLGRCNFRLLVRWSDVVEFFSNSLIEAATIRMTFNRSLSRWKLGTNLLSKDLEYLVSVCTGKVAK